MGLSSCLCWKKSRSLRTLCTSDLQQKPDLFHPCAGVVGPCWSFGERLLIKRPHSNTETHLLTSPSLQATLVPHCSNSDFTTCNVCSLISASYCYTVSLASHITEWRLSVRRILTDSLTSGNYVKLYKIFKNGAKAPDYVPLLSSYTNFMWNFE